MISVMNQSMIDSADSKASDDLTLMKLIYLIFEVLVATCSIIGNSLIIVSFLQYAHLRTPTNLYVFSLAIADLLVSSVGIPIYLYSMITNWPSDYLACLIVNTWIMMLCTVSIFHLVAVSFDRYMAVVWMRQPDSRIERMRQATCSIGVAWICGTVIGFLPLMGWNRGPSSKGTCVFVEIMDMRYLIFLFYGTIIAPTFLMAFFYVSIYRVVQKQDKRMGRRLRSESESADPVAIQSRCQSVHLSVGTCRKSESRHSSESRSSFSINYQNSTSRRLTMDKTKDAKKKTSKTTRVIMSFVLVILSFFASWYPLYILNAITFYMPNYSIDQAAFYACIVLSHLSTCVNPLIYARTMPGFKDVLLGTLKCQKSANPHRRQSSFYLISKKMEATSQMGENEKN